MLISENRKSLDKINEVYYGPEWGSTEFSPSGEYLVTELGVNWDHQSGQVVLDSVYIYNTNNFVMEETLLNAHGEKDINFSSFENIMSSTYGNILTIFNFDTKESKTKTFESYLHHILFSSELQKMYISIGSSKSVIYNYKNEIIDFEVSIPFFAFINVSDNMILGGSLYEFALFNANWDGLTSVSQTGNEGNVLFPNPSDSILNINLEILNKGIYSYQIFDMNSSLVLTNELGFLEEGSNSISVNINSLSPKSYILRISSDRESYNFKIIKE